VWDIATLKAVATLHGHKGSVLALLAHEGKLYSSSTDNSIRMWDLSTFQCTKVVLAGPANIYTLVAAPPFLFAGLQDTTLRSYALADLTLSPAPFTGHLGYVYSLLAVPELFLLCSGAGDGLVRLWDLQNPALPSIALSGHTRAVLTLARHGAIVYSGSRDRSIRVWDLHSRLCIRTLSAHSADVLALATTPTRLYSAAADHVIRLWDRYTLLPLFTVAHPHTPVALTPLLGTPFATADGATVCLWTPASPSLEPPPEMPAPWRSMTDLLSLFVSIPSVSGTPGSAGPGWLAANFLLARLQDLGIQSRLIPSPVAGKNPVLLGRLGSNPAYPSNTFLLLHLPSPF
jgi:WD40 repeat protein